MDEKTYNIVKEWTTEVIADIRQVLIDKNINATGSLSDSLHEEILTDEVIIWATEHSIWTDEGRGPTKNTNGNGELIEKIKEWVLAKGVNINPYAITKSIHEKGTKAYIENENRGVFDNDTFWNPRIEKLKKLLSETYISKINSITSDLWKI